MITAGLCVQSALTSPMKVRSLFLESSRLENGWNYPKQFDINKIRHGLLAHI